MKEKIVIIFIALAIGLFLTTIGFYFYQTNKNNSKNTPVKNTEKKEISKTNNVPGSENLFLTVDEPKNESLTDTRTIDVKGKTNPQNTLIVSSNTDDAAGTPNSDGSFSIDLAIEANTNVITIRAVAPNGEETKLQRIVTYSTEDF